MSATWSKALAALVEGADGVRQRQMVRRCLREMESAGLVEYRQAGWYLTESGRRVAGRLL